MSDLEALSLVAQLAGLVGEFRAASTEAKQLVTEAKAIAESARATAAQNERVFRTILHVATTQDEKCREHRELTETLERRLSLLEGRKGVG